jgi:hypothetical protein
MLQPEYADPDPDLRPILPRRPLTIAEQEAHEALALAVQLGRREHLTYDTRFELRDHRELVISLSDTYWSEMRFDSWCKLIAKEFTDRFPFVPICIVPPRNYVPACIQRERARRETERAREIEAKRKAEDAARDRSIGLPAITRPGMRWNAHGTSGELRVSAECDSKTPWKASHLLYLRNTTCTAIIPVHGVLAIAYDCRRVLLFYHQNDWHRTPCWKLNLDRKGNSVGADADFACWVDGYTQWKLVAL